MMVAGGGNMEKQLLNKILNQIAKEHHTTPENVYQEMKLALEMGQADPDPAIRAKWDSIPKSGNTLTVEEFLEFMAIYLNLMS